MTYIKQELKIFLTAVMFYTRIPCPTWTEHDPKHINESIRYFPFIGWIVGILSAATYLIAQDLIGASFAAISSIVVSVLITGAFHEDGFADSCDGFGGGWSKAKILTIMKDSRIGAFGAIGLILLMLTKFSLLSEFIILQSDLTIAIVAAHSLSRWLASTIVFTHEYVRDTDDSKAKPVADQTSRYNLYIGALFGLVPLVTLCITTHSIYWITLLLPLWIIKLRVTKYFHKWIGGYTGDCLGAAQQVFEVSIYLFVLIIWKFI